MTAIEWRFAPHIVEDALQKWLSAVRTEANSPSDVQSDAHLRAAMRHAVFSGGKRLRSQLVMEAAGVVAAANGEPSNARRALSPACALEMIHAYSLVHDDLPAMDNADTRRGRPSCHKAFGEAVAVLAGDALLTMAFEIVASDEFLEAQRALRLVKLVAHAAGEAGMVGGQAVDIAWSDAETKGAVEISGTQLLAMHARKTGALLRASAEAGAIAGGGSEAQIAALRDYGTHLGRAFQIADDVLDVIGDPQLTGKASSDAANNKTTATALFGLEGAQSLARESRDAALASLKAFGPEADALRELARYVVEREK
jgi:geranylgeranyl diphosphate synthase type II